MPVTERALAGRLLSQLGDPRPGVGLNEDGLPDIVWGRTIPAGQHDYVHEGYKAAKSYQLAIYPITYAQFQAFIEASDYDDSRWWNRMPEQQELFGESLVTKDISIAAFPLNSHPRERVSWYQAVAFYQRESS